MLLTLGLTITSLCLFLCLSTFTENLEWKGKKVSSLNNENFFFGSLQRLSKTVNLHARGLKYIKKNVRFQILSVYINTKVHNFQSLLAGVDTTNHTILSMD